MLISLHFFFLMIPGGILILPLEKIDSNFKKPFDALLFKYFKETRSSVVHVPREP